MTIVWNINITLGGALKKGCCEIFNIFKNYKVEEIFAFKFKNEAIKTGTKILQSQEQSKHGTVLITLTFKYFDPKN